MIRRGNSADVALLQRLGMTTFEDTFGNTCTREDMKSVLSLYFNDAQCLLELTDEEDHFYFLHLDRFHILKDY